MLISKEEVLKCLCDLCNNVRDVKPKGPKNHEDKQRK